MTSAERSFLLPCSQLPSKLLDLSCLQVQEDHHMPGGGQGEERVPGVPAGPGLQHPSAGQGCCAGSGG